MNKRELIDTLQVKQNSLPDDKIDDVVDDIHHFIIDALNQQQRIEIRGFGVFETRKWKPRFARNPATGESWRTPPVHAVYFKPSKALHNRVNA